MGNRQIETCANCAHDGCCDRYCGGAYWQAEEPDDGEERDDGDPWEGYDERDAMEERAWAYQQQMDEKW
jgi:hypothetical protein